MFLGILDNNGKHPPPLFIVSSMEVREMYTEVGLSQI